MRLKELRESRHITKLELAMDLNLNLTQNTISRYETGEREPGVMKLMLIADYFNVSLEYLLARTNNQKLSL